jgi:3-oxosteroid 1-dehydrogenase
MPGQQTPSWIESAPSLDELARKIGVDAAGLAKTVERFNAFARAGSDADFRRGESVYDHFYGDPEHKPNPNLGTLEKPPFYALEVHPGAIGTKGGAKVNVHAQVLKVDGQPITGLYAAGNVMAGVTGPGYPGAGATIGTAMTFGLIAGKHAGVQRG